ncbi:hypothetical protein SISSUDRAFT_1062735 [Sistotremastrum suecicum HHB10207 ss-3]|uniref:Uncharacterized protein n=1 Tax=Sistotremastrum suecicum HHB10207 ss-3 TaxID=1314776 RepID=A0A166CKX7_9AGAM|nr:hypothetical protein SISSUDRAFT_1062735 [Sistotremastrum suecicum HHB10207 ss-3]
MSAPILTKAVSVGTDAQVHEVAKRSQDRLPPLSHSSSMSTPPEPPEPTSSFPAPAPDPDPAAPPNPFNTSFSPESLNEHNADLRALFLLPFEECVARVLCSYNRRGKLGDRRRIFDLAQKHCEDLLDEGKTDDVRRILSHVDRLDIIKSFIKHPGAISSPLLEFIVKDHNHAILREINQSMQYGQIDQSRFIPHSLFSVFLALAPPSRIDIDISPLIDYLSEHPDWLTWAKTSTTIITYIEAYPLPQISDRTTLRRFLDHCVDTDFRDKYNTPYRTSDDTRARAEYLLFQLDCISSPPLLPPPRFVFATLFNVLTFPFRPLSYIRTPNNTFKPKPSLPQAPSSTLAVLDLNNSFPPSANTAPNTPFPTINILPNHPPPIPLPSSTDPSLVNYFQAEVYLASLNPNNTDLRPLSALPFDECLARVLCSYNHQYHQYSRSNDNDDADNDDADNDDADNDDADNDNNDGTGDGDGEASRSNNWWRLGDRTRIFNMAQRHCTYLLGEGKHDDVTRILSHVSPFDLIKSFIHHPRFISFPLVRFIVHDCKHRILDHLNEFVHTAAQFKFNPIALSDVFVVLASPPPPSIDLSPLISYLAQHTDKRTWQWTSDTVFAYLNSYDLAEISDLNAVRQFLRLRLRVEFYDEDYEHDEDGDGEWSATSSQTRVRANRLLGELERTSLLSSLDDPVLIASTSSPSSTSATSPDPPPDPAPAPKSLSSHHNPLAIDPDPDPDPDAPQSRSNSPSSHPSVGSNIDLADVLPFANANCDSDNTHSENPEAMGSIDLGHPESMLSSSEVDGDGDGDIALVPESQASEVGRGSSEEFDNGDEDLLQSTSRDYDI